MAQPKSTRPTAYRSPEVTAQAQLARLYAAHGREVLAYALRRAATPEDAADAVAETFLVAWRRLRDVHGEQSLSTTHILYSHTRSRTNQRDHDRRGRFNLRRPGRCL